nr:lipocalin family protein [Mucilaginibacter sp. L294]
MKKALLLVAAIICLASCKKDKTKVIIDDRGVIFGTWELRAIYGGWGQPQTFAKGNGNKFTFKPDSTYIKYTDNAIEKQGKFSVRFTGEEKNLRYGTITLTDPAYTDAFSFTLDTIHIGSSAADGPSYQYVRVKK